MLTTLNLAIVGAGPAGLAMALLAAERLPHAHITLFDGRNADADLQADARTLALSLGSVMLLQRLAAWPVAQAQAITRVHVSQAAPSWRDSTVLIDAQEQAVPLLGAVLGYGSLLQALQGRWLQLCQTQGQRLHSRFGHAVRGLKTLPDAVEVDAAIAEAFDLVVVAEGGLFGEQDAATRPQQQGQAAATPAPWRLPNGLLSGLPPRLHSDYQQQAWVGTVPLQSAHGGVAYERFTRNGPLALLPLLPLAAGAAGVSGGAGHASASRHRAALVWCMRADDDCGQRLPVAARLTLLNSLLPEAAPRVAALPELACFKLGLNASTSLVQGRVVRMGNAAQTLHPVAGQGLNLGLRDAYALVEELQRADHVEAALARVNWARGADRFSMIATTDLLARGFAWPWPPLAGARGLALAALQHAPPLKRLLARHLMFGWR